MARHYTHEDNQVHEDRIGEADKEGKKCCKDVIEYWLEAFKLAESTKIDTEIVAQNAANLFNKKYNKKEYIIGQAPAKPIDNNEEKKLEERQEKDEYLIKDSKQEEGIPDKKQKKNTENIPTEKPLEIKDLPPSAVLNKAKTAAKDGNASFALSLFKEHYFYKMGTEERADPAIVSQALRFYFSLLTKNLLGGFNEKLNAEITEEILKEAKTIILIAKANNQNMIPAPLATLYLQIKIEGFYTLLLSDTKKAAGLLKEIVTIFNDNQQNYFNEKIAIIVENLLVIAKQNGIKTENLSLKTASSKQLADWEQQKQVNDFRRNYLQKVFRTNLGVSYEKTENQIHTENDFNNQLETNKLMAEYAQEELNLFIEPLIELSMGKISKEQFLSTLKEDYIFNEFMQELQNFKVNLSTKHFSTILSKYRNFVLRERFAVLFNYDAIALILKHSEKLESTFYEKNYANNTGEEFDFDKRRYELIKLLKFSSTLLKNSAWLVAKDEILQAHQQLKVLTEKYLVKYFKTNYQNLKNKQQAHRDEFNEINFLANYFDLSQAIKSPQNDEQRFIGLGLILVQLRTTGEVNPDFIDSIAGTAFKLANDNLSSEYKKETKSLVKDILTLLLDKPEHEHNSQLTAAFKKLDEKNFNLLVSVNKMKEKNNKLKNENDFNLETCKETLTEVEKKFEIIPDLIYEEKEAKNKINIFTLNYLVLLPHLKPCTTK